MNKQLAWNESELWAGALEATRMVYGSGGGCERGVTACIVLAEDKAQSLDLAMQEAMKALPTTEGWVHHKAVTVRYTVAVEGNVGALAMAGAR